MASHTTTGEWKTFELRMRRRRVERLLRRAEVAADEGRYDETRDCLDEAERLAPGLPTLGGIRARLAVPPASGAARPRVAAAAGRSQWGLATALVTVGIIIWYRPPTTLPSHDFRSEAWLPVAHTAEVRPASLRASYPVNPLPTVEPMPEEPPQPIVTRPDSAPVLASALRRAPNEFMRTGDTTRTEITRASDPPRVDTPRAPETKPRDEGPSDIAPVSEVVAVATAGVALPPLPPAVPADSAVRQALEGYASAYNSLDADAAQRVWPTVNRSALARAFDALASQHLSLGACRIDINGATARASCSGSATWTARVGDGSPRTEARQWTFELAGDGAAWRIVSARAQNR